MGPRHDARVPPKISCGLLGMVRDVGRTWITPEDFSRGHNMIMALAVLLVPRILTVAQMVIRRNDPVPDQIKETRFRDSW